MIRGLLIVVVIMTALFGTEFKVAEHSFGFYEAKKEQFFSTYEIRGVSKAVRGRVSKRNGTYTGFVRIDAGSFKSGSGMRDTHVREDYLQADIHPYITQTFTVSNGTAKGTITINGVAKKIAFPVEVVEEESGVIISGKAKVRYSDFNIKTPSNLILSAHEELFIGATLFLEQE